MARRIRNALLICVAVCAALVFIDAWLGIGVAIEQAPASTPTIFDTAFWWIFAAMALGIAGMGALVMWRAAELPLSRSVSRWPRVFGLAGVWAGLSGVWYTSTKALYAPDNHLGEGAFLFLALGLGPCFVLALAARIVLLREQGGR